MVVEKENNSNATLAENPDVTMRGKQ